MSSALVSTARPHAPLLIGVTPARVGQRRWALAVDAAPLVLGAAVAVGQLQMGRTDLVILTGLVLVLGLLAQAGLLISRGQSLGRLLFRLRTVDDLTGLPVSLRSLPDRLVGPVQSLDVLTADLSRGRDPLDLALPAVSDAVTLVFDTGRRYALNSSLLIGRSPDNTHPPGGVPTDHPLLGMADLSRTLAKTHALLEWSGSVLWVTDLHSTHGSLLVTPGGERRPLAPGTRGAAEIGWTVHCGDRFFSVHGLRPVGDSR